MKVPIHVDKDQRLSLAVDLFEKHNIARLPVVDEDILVGIITQRDIMEKIGYFKEDIKVSTFHISTCMTRDPFTLHPSDPIEKAVALFRAKGISGIPVVDQGLVGIVTKLDVIEVSTFSQNVNDFFTPTFLSISIDGRVVHARMLMLKHNERCLPVINGTLQGVITTSDVVLELYRFMEMIDRHQSTLARNIPVIEAMNQNPTTCTLFQDMEAVKAVMIEKNLSTLPVVNDENEVLGLISKDQMIEGIFHSQLP